MEEQNEMCMTKIKIIVQLFEIIKLNCRIVHGELAMVSWPWCVGSGELAMAKQPQQIVPFWCLEI